MTKNNLREHLTWLLDTNAFAPPTILPITQNETTSSRSSRGIAVPIVPAREITSLDPGSTNLGSNNVVGAEEQPEFLLPAIPSRITTTRYSEAMARLQSGPRSTHKSRLLIHASPDPLQQPTPESARPPNSSLRDRYNSAFQQGMYCIHPRASGS